MTARLPIIVLAGSDPHPGAVPAELSPDAMLTGPKGTILLRSGRCMAAELVARIRASERFTEPLLLGPRHLYEGLIDCELSHVEGSMIQTLRHLTEVVQSRFGGSQPLAVVPCDVLPSGEDFQRLLDEDYAPHAATMFWWQMVQSEASAMGAGAWKPAYHLPPAPGQEPLSLYPGHLVIARPAALRFRLMNRILELAYRFRNLVLDNRYLGMTRGILGTLAAEDLRNLVKLELPTLTFQIPYLGLRGFFRYRRGEATLREVEHFLAKSFLHRRFHRAAAGRPVVISISSLLPFAKDIDTRAELDEL